MSPTFELKSRTYPGIIPGPAGLHIDQPGQKTPEMFIQGVVFL
jgi:hypothetical protein